jgi:hypothetical protein
MSAAAARRVYASRVAVTTPAAIEKIALDLGCYYIAKGGEVKGSPGVLLDRIADGTFKITFAGLDHGLAQ